MRPAGSRSATAAARNSVSTSDGAIAPALSSAPIAGSATATPEIMKGGANCDAAIAGTSKGWLVFVVPAAAARDDVFLPDLVDVEALDLAADGLQQVLELGRLLHEAQRVRARDDKTLQIRTDEALRLELLHHLGDALVELEQHRGDSLVLAQRLCQ